MSTTSNNEQVHDEHGSNEQEAISHSLETFFQEENCLSLSTKCYYATLIGGIMKSLGKPKEDFSKLSSEDLEIFLLSGLKSIGLKCKENQMALRTYIVSKSAVWKYLNYVRVKSGVPVLSKVDKIVLETKYDLIK